MRLVTLATGLAALLVGPAIAGAQTTNATGADRYGGAKVGEDLNKPSTQTGQTDQNQNDTTTPRQNQAQPSEVQPTSGHDQTQDTTRPQQTTPSASTPSTSTTTNSVDQTSPSATPPTVNQNVTVTPAQPNPQPQSQEQPAQPQINVQPAQQPPPEVNVYMPPQPQSQRRIVEERQEPHPLGLALSIGGGINQFSGREMRDATNMGGTWDARVAFGTRSLIGLEAAYVGSAAPINSLGLSDNALLMSNGVEGLARLNVGTFDFQPFIVGGVAWQRYSIENSTRNTSDFEDSDDVLAIPFGGGVSTYIGGRASHFMVDARFIYRSTFNDNLARPGTANAGGNGLSNWSTTLRLGYEF